MKKPTVTITLSGKQGAGKSQVARLIRRAMPRPWARMFSYRIVEKQT